MKLESNPNKQNYSFIVTIKIYFLHLVLDVMFLFYMWGIKESWICMLSVFVKQILICTYIYIFLLPNIKKNVTFFVQRFKNESMTSGWKTEETGQSNNNDASEYYLIKVTQYFSL